MTKARDLANIISGGFDATDIPNLDTAKITSGTLADARIPNLSTAKITSGTLADARFPATLPAISGANLTNLPAGGKLLQVVQAVKNDTFSSNSASWVDITGLSLSITPSATSSKFFITANFVTSHSIANSLGVKLLRDSTAIYQGDDTQTRKGTSSWQYVAGSNRNVGSNSFQYVDSPNTTSATTYKLQIWATGGTAYIGKMSGDSNNATYGRSASSIIAMEIGV